MADLTQPTAGLPDMQDLMGQMVSQIQPAMRDTQAQMSAMQDYIRNQSANQLNIPALQFAAGLLKPTRTGSFGESVGNAGEGALGALQKQREIDLDRQSKILELQQAKGNLLSQQAQMLLPYAQMQTAQKMVAGLHQPQGDGAGSPQGAGGGNDDAWQNLGEAGAVMNNKGLQDLYTTHMRFSPQVAGDRELQEQLNKPYKYVGTDGVEKTVPYWKYLQETGQGRTQPPPQSASKPPAAVTAEAPVAAAPAAAVAPQQPVVDPVTADVHSYVPPPPPGGGLPAIPPGATGLPPGYEKQAENAVAVQKDWAKDAGDLDTMKNRFRELNYLGKLAESNQWSTAKATIASNLKALALQIDPTTDVSKMDADKWGKPAEIQQQIKDVTQLAMATARAQGSRGTNMVLQEAMLTTPQPDMQPVARWTLINHGLAAIDRRQQMMADWQTAQAKGWKDPNVFEQTWLKANPIDKWVQATSEKAGNFAGMPLPPKLHVGATYVAPPGSKHAGELGVWNGESFDPPNPDDMTGMGPK